MSNGIELPFDQLFTNFVAERADQVMRNDDIAVRRWGRYRLTDRSDQLVPFNSITYKTSTLQPESAHDVSIHSMEYSLGGAAFVMGLVTISYIEGEFKVSSDRARSYELSPEEIGMPALIANIKAAEESGVLKRFYFKHHKTTQT